MVDRRPARLAALVESIEAAHLDALLLTGVPNIRYLTGFSGSSALLLVTPREALFLTDFRYETQAGDEVGGTARIRVETASLWRGLWREMPRYDAVRLIGFEAGHLTYRDFQRLQEEGERWQWRPTVDLAETLRERKDPEEVELISRAAAVAVRALERVLPTIGAGMTELAVAGTLELALREEGSEGFPFPTIVASGPRAALPHARSSGRRLERGDLLLLDFGAEVGGYCADITRTFVVGSATAEQREIHGVVRQANELAVAQLRPGMLGRDADAIARGYIERRGYGEAFGHSLGHGLGLEVHEAPRLARTSETALPCGAVVTIEPGIYRPGWGGVRIEDDVHLGEGGAELLTHFPRELLEIT